MAIPWGLRAAEDTPRLVAVETTSRCNAKCSFCPNSALTRKAGAIDDALFEKIIEDCRAFPLAAIEPFLNGEPFADPRILTRLELVRRRLPKTRLRLYTNGYALTPRRADDLTGLGIDHLYVSLNTVDPTRYRETMGLDLERTLSNLDYLTDRARKRRVARRMTFRMTRLPDTTLAEQDAFLEYCKARGVRPFVTGLYNYTGDIPSPLPVAPYACEHVHRLDILSSGRVALCCMDQDGEFGWGSAEESSVLELYQHATARRYRRLHAIGKRRTISPCSTCNNYWPGFRGMGPIAALHTLAGHLSYLARNRPNGRKAPLRGNSRTL